MAQFLLSASLQLPSGYKSAGLRRIAGLTWSWFDIALWYRRRQNVFQQQISLFNMISPQHTMAVFHPRILHLPRDVTGILALILFLSPFCLRYNKRYRAKMCRFGFPKPVSRRKKCLLNSTKTFWISRTVCGTSHQWNLLSRHHLLVMTCAVRLPIFRSRR